MGEGVVLVAVEQVPEDDGQFARDSDSGDLVSWCAASLRDRLTLRSRPRYAPPFMWGLVVTPPGSVWGSSRLDWRISDALACDLGGLRWLQTQLALLNACLQQFESS